MSVVKSLLATSLAFALVSLVGCSDSGDSAAPNITNLSHTDNQKVIGNRTITLSADVSDDSSVASVTITHNGNSQTVTNTSGAYSANITLADRANNTVVITATDASNNQTIQTIVLDYPFHSFANGQAASVVIGQPDFYTTIANQGGMVGANTLYEPYAVRVINNKLYIADGGNNRVLGFNAIPAVNNASADFVIGQDSFTTDSLGYSNTQLNRPRGIASNGSNFFISHAGFGRIHYWSSVPTSNVSAEVVTGKPDFITGTGFVCAQDVFFFAAGSIFNVNGKLIAVDFLNRILIWNSIPTINGQAADLVLGQQNFTNCASNDSDGDGTPDTPTASTLNSVSSIWTDGTRLVATDRLNHRVLIWNTFPTVSGQPADLVLGQPDFTTINTPSQSYNPIDLDQPSGVYSNGNQLFVSTRRRVLIWNSWPSVNHQAADGVLGHIDLNGDNTGLGNDALMDNPTNIYIYDSKLFVSDNNDDRVLIFEAP